MSPIRLSLLAMIVATVPFTASRVFGDDDKDETVAFDQLPPKVQATFLKESGAEKLDDVEKETDDGRVIYEAEVDIDGKRYEIEVDEDGTLLYKKLESYKDDDDDDDKD